MPGCFLKLVHMSFDVNNKKLIGVIMVTLGVQTEKIDVIFRAVVQQIVTTHGANVAAVNVKTLSTYHTIHLY
jgi:hypothetical protein